MSTQLEFSTTLVQLEGKIQWTVFYIPYSIVDVYRVNGRCNVVVTIDGYSYSGTLLPSKNGHYMVYNKSMKAVSNKNIGDCVHVVLKLDTEAREITIPDYIQAQLDTSPSAKSEFEQLPYYIKREEIIKIEDAKKPETKIRRVSKLIDRLIESNARRVQDGMEDQSE